MTKLYENNKYEVVGSDNVIGEDGEYGQTGYAVVNKETGVAEMTTMVLPSAIYHSNHFNDMLESFDEPQEKTNLEVINFPDDVVPN